MKANTTLDKVLRLKQLFDAGKIKQEHKHEVNPGLDKDSRLNYLYFTLPVSINYQRSSTAMWESALKTFNDPETNYVFYPEEVIKAPFKKLQSDLLRHKLALQRNKHVEIWSKISSTLAEFYNSDPREVIIEGNTNVSEILDNIRKVYKKRFPYLSGSKMSNYWLYILHNFTDVKLNNLEMISIIPDTHVQQCSLLLGISQVGDTPDTISNNWFELLKDSGINPIDMHPVLWNWSRSNFQPQV